MQEMLSATAHSSSAEDNDSPVENLDAGAEALARLLAFKDDAEDELAVAAAQRAVLERRKAALSAQVRELKAALLAREVECAALEKHIQSCEKFINGEPDREAKVEELEDKVRTLEAQNAQHVRARIDCPCCSLPEQ